jgi:acetyl esterase/lipase
MSNDTSKVSGAGVLAVFRAVPHATEDDFAKVIDAELARAKELVEQGVIVHGYHRADLVGAALVLDAATVDFRHQVLLYPPLSADCDTDSYRRFAEGYGQSAGQLRRLWRWYVPDPAGRTEPTAAPLHAEPARLAAVPPALVITAEADVVRDEAEAYAAKLRAAGVPVDRVRYPGTVHAFAVLDALRETPAARDALARIAGTLREALHP